MTSGKKVAALALVAALVGAVVGGTATYVQVHRSVDHRFQRLETQVDELKSTQAQDAQSAKDALVYLAGQLKSALDRNYALGTGAECFSADFGASVRVLTRSTFGSASTEEICVTQRSR